MAYRLQMLKPFLEEAEPYRCRTCPYCNGTRDATVKHPKPDPFDWWKSLGSPKTVVAPMVDQSELPFRMMCRKYGAELAYTPMYNSRVFAADVEYRKFNHSTVPEDRPLFVQFCGNDGDTVLAAARHVEKECDAVDINLGCPQGIAKKGHYGSYLMEHWDVIHTVLHTLSVELAIPVVAKMRVFEDDDLTLRYARMIRDAGVHLIAVHGRTREMKGQQTGVANLDIIAKIKSHITNVPIIANGNIQVYDDVSANLKKTGCEAVMSAEGLLWDPRLFANPKHPVMTGRSFQADKATRLGAIAAAKEYMEFARKYPTPFANVKSHVFKMVHHSLEVVPEFRMRMGQIPGTKNNMEVLAEVVDSLEKADGENGPEGAYVKREKVREKRERGPQTATASLTTTPTQGAEKDLTPGTAAAPPPPRATQAVSAAQIAAVVAAAKDSESSRSPTSQAARSEALTVN